MRFLLFIRVRDSKKTFRNAAGFTLIELLLVITLLAVLAVAAISAFDGNEEQARYNITRLEMAELQKALLQFRRDNREFPCQVYLAGDYSPSIDMQAVYSFESGTEGVVTVPETPSSLADYELWCSDSLPGDPAPKHPEDVIQAENGLTMLNRFPYDSLNDKSLLLWNRDTQRGWNGPYISTEALKDGWGRPYKLLNPELAFGQGYLCKEDSGKYAIIGNEYGCLPVSAILALPLAEQNTYTLPGDIVRVASAGADGIFQSVKIDNTNNFSFDPDVCQPADNSDDLVLCLLR